jgi:hypothetical protein
MITSSTFLQDAMKKTTRIKPDIRPKDKGLILEGCKYLFFNQESSLIIQFYGMDDRNQNINSHHALRII